MNSEVELLFKQLSEKLEGNLTWHELNPAHQHQFVQAVNVLLNLCSLRK